MGVFVRAEKANCSECRDALLNDCKEHGFPMPTGEVFEIRTVWLRYNCPHMSDGLVLVEHYYAMEAAVPDQSSSAQDLRAKAIQDAQSPWQLNLDATKDMGYPCREYGSRYGSYPSHDDFDDESEP